MGAMRERQRLLSALRRAIQDYQMIGANDTVAVGLSGGKDSLTLLALLSDLRQFYPLPYTLHAFTVAMGFPGEDHRPIATLCERLSIPYTVIPTDIAEIVFDRRQEPNPCSLCARMRRGALTAAAEAAGCQRLALGHHRDDAVETFMMNLFFEGRIGCFSPVTALGARAITVIRPLIYAREDDIARYARTAALPVTPSLCPENCQTERERMKHLLTDWEREHRGLRHRLFHAICQGEVDGFRLPCGTAAPDTVLPSEGTGTATENGRPSHNQPNEQETGSPP